MLNSGKNWELFGYDTRSLGRYWLTAWRDLLWSGASPIRRRLDEAVCLHSEGGSSLYQAGQPSRPVPHVCEAVLLPDDLVLSRSLRLPLAAERELASALQLEVHANSPFSPDDTASGWLLLERGDTHLQVALAIVSRSAVMTYLGRRYDIHDARAREVWAEAGGRHVLLAGFGEGARESRYRRRLLRCGAMVAAAALLVLVIAGVAGLAKRIELSQLQSLAQRVEREAAAASRMRSALASTNENIAAANEVISAYPNPHVELARLSRLLGDDAYILQFAMDGTEIRLRGRAVNAAAVMETLTNQDQYVEVTAPSAIVSVAKSDLEQFALNIKLGQESGG